MKRMVFLTLVVVLSLGGLVRAADDAVRSVSVSGTVETKIAPDLVVWRISLTDTDKDLRAAKRANDENVKAVLALRSKLGIAEGNLETGQVSIQREYERDQHGQRGAFKHFAVHRSITIRQRELNRFDEYLDSLVASADMEVDFSFESSKIHDIRAETRLQALVAAKKKAQAMAQVVGAKLGRVLTINEHAENWGYSNPLSNSMSFRSAPSVDAASETFVPGAISVSMTVYAVFELE
jgi:uncharacterized protein YggE